MSSIIRTLRDKMRHIPADNPLNYSKITDQIYIGAWPVKHNRDEVIDLGITLLISTILESVDKELNEAPLKLVRTRGTDLGPTLIFPMSQLMKGATAGVNAIANGEKIMVFCKAGEHRSPTMTACILVALGHSADEAIKMVLDARDIADINKSHNKKIHEFEREWKKR